MANVEWQEIIHTMTSLKSDGVTQNTQIVFNAFLDGETTGPQFILDPDKCQAGSAKRVTRDNSPQRAGEIMHKHFKTGFVMQVGGIYANVTTIDPGTPGIAGCEMEPLCGADLVALDDLLMLNLDAMENVDGNYYWFPSGYPISSPYDAVARGLFGTRWLGPDGLGGSAFTAVLTEREDQVFVGFQFALVTPFPYAMDLSNVITVFETALVDSTPVTINNVGTTPYWPVVHVNASGSEVDEFEIKNNTTGMSMIYSSAFPGASPILSGHYIEFDFFRNTAYFDGDGDNAKPGIDIQNSDFWSLVPGDNSIELDGTGGSILWAGAYV